MEIMTNKIMFKAAREGISLIAILIRHSQNMKKRKHKKRNKLIKTTKEPKRKGSN